ncbi:hypothetical protein C8R47DRAFT_1254782 [Mycena vitilis]|nr:hypothetical protein C8R47DRAFT_1254782 [Mycena vitilis]
MSLASSQSGVRLPASECPGIHNLIFVVELCKFGNVLCYFSRYWREPPTLTCNALDIHLIIIDGTHNSSPKFSSGSDCFFELRKRYLSTCSSSSQDLKAQFPIVHILGLWTHHTSIKNRTWCTAHGEHTLVVHWQVRIPGFDSARPNAQLLIFLVELPQRPLLFFALLAYISHSDMQRAGYLSNHHRRYAQPTGIGFPMFPGDSYPAREVTNNPRPSLVNRILNSRFSRLSGAQRALTISRSHPARPNSSAISSFSSLSGPRRPASFQPQLTWRSDQVEEGIGRGARVTAHSEDEFHADLQARILGFDSPRSNER